MKHKKQKEPQTHATVAITSFSERVVAAALSIPKGKVTTYGRIARAAGGGAMSAQSITSILGRAWDGGERRIPFHRIVYASGKVWISPARRKERLELYRKEGIKIEKDCILNFQDHLFEF
jgi:methylated-DNA-protein-cysteine methyltransferase-like protein